MKNLIWSCLGLMFLASCSGTKVAVENEKLMRGDWTVTDVTVDGIDESYVNVTVFDGVNANCFEGSNWHLVQNNSTGNYALSGGADCPASSNKIKWFVTEEGGANYFNFKILYEGEKPKNVVDGYKMRISDNTGSSIKLTQDLTFEGKPIQVNYNFQKISN